jgi:hypothetical protein
VTKLDNIKWKKKKLEVAQEKKKLFFHGNVKKRCENERDGPADEKQISHFPSTDRCA